MNSLRARMAITLILAIACVVGFSTILIHHSLCAIGDKKFAEAVIVGCERLADRDWGRETQASRRPDLSRLSASCLSMFQVVSLSRF